MLMAKFNTTLWSRDLRYKEKSVYHFGIKYLTAVGVPRWIFLGGRGESLMYTTMSSLNKCT